MALCMIGWRRSGWLSLGWVLLFPGCAFIPTGDRPAEYMDPPEIKATLHEVEARLQQWPEDRWWEEFENPELTDLIEIALENNPGLKQASARLRQAQALVKVEGARLLPFLEADASVTYERLSQHGVFAALNPEVAGIRFLYGQLNPLSFRYELDFWGKNRAMLEAALGEAAAEEAERAAVRLHLTAAIARTFFRGQSLLLQLEIIQAMVDIRRHLRDLAQDRFRFGLDNEQPVRTAVADYEAAYKRFLLVRDHLDVQRHLLARLVGKGPDEGLRVGLSPKVATPKHIAAPDHLSIGLLVHRPDLAAALYRAYSASRMVRVAKTQFYPTIDLAGFVGLNALTLTKGADKLANLLFRGQSFSYGLVPGLRLPWFEGGRLRGELGARRAEYDVAVELYNETLLAAMQEVADGLSAWQTTTELLASHHRMLVSLEGDWELAKVRLVTGLDDDRKPLVHRYPVLEQLYVMKGLECDQLVAAVDLIESLGGGYHNPDLQKRPTYNSNE